MKGPIQRIARDRLERRDDARLPTAWFGADLLSVPALVTSAVFRDNGSVQSIDHGAPVLVLLAGEHPGALAELVAHAEAGARVYALAPAGWGKGKLDTWIGDYPTVLVRRVPEVPVSGVLRPSGAKIWASAAHGGLAPWCLRLDAAQADALRQVFLRLFWHDAVDEAWTGGKQLTFRPPVERPFDVPCVSLSAPMRLVAGETPIEVARGAVVHVSAEAPPSVVPHRLWIHPSGDHHDRLAALRRDGAEIGWTALDLPDIAVGPGAGVALLPGTRARLRVELNAAQVTDLEKILAQPPAWRFDIDVRLGDHTEPGVLFRLPGTSAAAALEREQSIEIGQVQADQIRVAPGTAPAKWPAPQPLALSVRYRWIVIPPRLPAGSEEDSLVGRWRKLDADYSARLAKVREAIEDAKQHRGRLRAAFSRLLGALTGFERTHEKLRKELEALASMTPSIEGPKNTPALLDRLARIEEDARKLQGDLEKTEREERELLEREKQEVEWKARVKQARLDLTDRRARIGELEARRPGLAAELTAIEAELASADKNADTNAAPDKNKSVNKTDKPNTDKSADKAQHKTVKPDKNKAAEPDGINPAVESKQVDKDRLARKRLLADELTQLDRELKRLQGEVAALERQTAEPFNFKPPATIVSRTPGAGRFVPTGDPTRPTREMPEEALPEIGELRHVRNQRFLVIDTWDNLAAGEVAASRLKARLVAPEDV